MLEFDKHERMTLMEALKIIPSNANNKSVLNI